MSDSKRYLVVEWELWNKLLATYRAVHRCPQPEPSDSSGYGIDSTVEDCNRCWSEWEKDNIRPLTATEMRAGKMEEVLKRVDMFVFPNTGDTYGLTAEISSILADIQKAKETTPEQGQGREVQR